MSINENLRLESFVRVLQKTPAVAVLTFEQEVKSRDKILCFKYLCLVTNKVIA